ncbi:MAG: YaaR family protein [Spirochaetes bacterium]|nr:YaaR family protein [Spirochaetota bacterium]
MDGVKIDDAFSQQRRINEKKKTSSASGARASNPLFQSVLKQQEIQFTDYDLEPEELKQQLEQAGDALDKDPSLEQFVKFRDLFRALTQKVSSEAYRLKTVGMSRNKRYEIVKIINTELDALYRLVRSTQKDRIAITNKIVRLKGLVVDVLS